MAMSLIRLALLAALALAPKGVQAVVGGQQDETWARLAVMVLSSRAGVCSGVLVASDVVLTAAHCVTAAPDHRVHFRAPDGKLELIEPVGTAVHPGYVADAARARRRSIDLALLRLPDPLPAYFQTAVLAPVPPVRLSPILVGGYGMLHESDIRSTGTFRTAAMRVAEPFGASRLLLWADGAGAAGACQGDSGGPIVQDGAIVAIISWATGLKGRRCGRFTLGILLAPQRDWIDRTLGGWGRRPQWR